MSENIQTIETAIAQGKLSLVQAFLDKQPELLEIQFVDNVGLTPLMWACRRRQEAVVRELLYRGANVQARNFTEPDGDGGNFALWFTANGDLLGGAPIAQLLVEHGADVNIVGEHGETALHQAAAWNNVQVAKVLIECGADVNAQHQKNKTPLSMALQRDHSKFAELLRQAGAAA